jgi:hypothetical protein
VPEYIPFLLEIPVTMPTSVAVYNLPSLTGVL